MVSSRRGAVLALMLIVIGASACTSPEERTAAGGE